MTLNRDDVIRMAREAGFDTDLPGFRDGSAIALKLAAAAFAAGAAAEREACAKVCDDLADASNLVYAGTAAMHCADAIRARGQA